MQKTNMDAQRRADKPGRGTVTHPPAVRIQSVTEVYPASGRDWTQSRRMDAIPCWRRDWQGLRSGKMPVQLAWANSIVIYAPQTPCFGLVMVALRRVNILMNKQGKVIFQ